MIKFFSDPPLEEDDIPDGEWLCNECKAKPFQVGHSCVSCVSFHWNENVDLY